MPHEESTPFDLQVSAIAEALKKQLGKQETDTYWAINAAAILGELHNDGWGLVGVPYELPQEGIYKEEST